MYVLFSSTDKKGKDGYEANAVPPTSCNAQATAANDVGVVNNRQAANNARLNAANNGDSDEEAADPFATDGESDDEYQLSGSESDTDDEPAASEDQGIFTDTENSQRD